MAHSLYGKPVSNQQIEQLKEVANECGYAISYSELFGLDSLRVDGANGRYVWVSVNEKGFQLNTTATAVNGEKAALFLKEMEERKRFVDKANELFGFIE